MARDHENSSYDGVLMMRMAMVEVAILLSMMVTVEMVLAIMVKLMLMTTMP